MLTPEVKKIIRERIQHREKDDFFLASMWYMELSYSLGQINREIYNRSSGNDYAKKYTSANMFLARFAVKKLWEICKKDPEKMELYKKVFNSEPYLYENWVLTQI